jgi:hypothetical protein
VQAEEQGSKLTNEELTANIILLFGAGHETTVNLIGNGLLALHRNPDQLELLRENPSLTPNAIEELLRYDSSVQVTGRTALEDVEAGVSVGEALRTARRFRSCLRASTLDALGWSSDLGVLSPEPTAECAGRLPPPCDWIR